MITDPRFAPKRAELTFLARRSRPKQKQVPETPAAQTAPPASAPKVDYRRPDRERTPPPPAAAPARPASEESRPAAASGSSSLDLSGSSPSAGDAPKVDYHRPDRDRTPSPPAQPAQPAASSSGSLDLSAPATPPPSGGGVDYSRQGGSGALDLSAGAPQPSPPRRPANPASESSGSLDLSAAPAPAAAAAVRRRPEQRVHADARVHGRGQHLLSIKDPTVALSRLQSGIGELSVEAICSPEVGDLRLGAVYQLRSGGSLTVQHADGHRFAPPKSRRPVLVATREEYERISLDLRQIRDIERVGIYAYSESRTELTWNGTLVVTTFGGARIELPLETLYPGRIAMVLSIYNLDGELVIRAELETIAGDVRDAARAYGYDRITWRDARAPVD